MTNLKSAFKHISFVKSCSTDLSEERSLKFCPWCDAQDVCETQWAVSTNTGPGAERFIHQSVNQTIQSPMQKQRWSRRFEGSFIAHKLTLVKKYPHVLTQNTPNLSFSGEIEYCELNTISQRA